MADTAISALTAVGSAAAAQEFPVNDAGTTKKVTLTQLAAFMSNNANWRFLGVATASAATDTGEVIWTGNYDQLCIFHFIAGYGGNGIGRVMTHASATPSNTATDHCCELIEGVTRNTTSVSVSGWPTAVTSNTAARWGVMYVNNSATGPRRMFGNGQWGGTAATAVPTNQTCNGLASPTSRIQRVKMRSYSAITGTGVGGTFNAGTYVLVYGRNSD